MPDAISVTTNSTEQTLPAIPGYNAPAYDPSNVSYPTGTYDLNANQLAFYQAGGYEATLTGSNSFLNNYGNTTPSSATGVTYGSNGTTLTTGISGSGFGGQANNTTFQASATMTPTSDPFSASASNTVLQGQVDFQQPPPPPPPPIITTQVVKADIKNTVVQPIEPCRSIPYLKFVFLPVDTTVRFRRDLRREFSIPTPRPLQMSVTDFVSLFAGHVHIKDPKYVLRWKQVLPTVVEPQDSQTVNYKSVDIYDFRTSVIVNSTNILDQLDFSQLPLTQITKGQDIKGGTLNPDLDDYELYLDTIIYADVDQATGKLIAKDPVEAGILLAG